MLTLINKEWKSYMKYSRIKLLKLTLKPLLLVDFVSLVSNIENIGIEFHNELRNNMNNIANLKRILKFVDKKKIKKYIALAKILCDRCEHQMTTLQTGEAQA